MTHKITILPSGITFDAEKIASILDNALKSNINLPHGCKNGQCGQCKATLISGEISDKNNNVIKVGDSLLTCCSVIRSDLTIQADYYPELTAIDVKTLPCKVNSTSMVSADVIKLILRLPPTASFDYLPGQYIDLKYKNIIRSYSIANAKKESNHIELHIRRVLNGLMSQILFETPQLENTLMHIEGPKGTFFVHPSERPLILLAGGTGFAPIKAIVENLLSIKQENRPLYIYWGMPRSADFYSTLGNEWAKQFKHIHYIEVVSEFDQNWSGRTGFVHQAVLDDFESLVDFDVYACGSTLMVNNAKNDFLMKGLNSACFFSDAFTPAII